MPIEKLHQFVYEWRYLMNSIGSILASARKAKKLSQPELSATKGKKEEEGATAAKPAEKK